VCDYVCEVKMRFYQQEIIQAEACNNGCWINLEDVKVRQEEKSDH